MHQIRATFCGKLVNYITKIGRFVPNITCGQMSYGSYDLLENGPSNEIITLGAREEATQSS